MVAQQSLLTHPAASLPPELFERFFLRGLLPSDHVIVGNSTPYFVGSKEVYVLTRLDGHLYRIVGQTALSQDEYQVVRALFEAYPEGIYYPDDSPVHRILVRCKIKLASVGIELYRTKQNSYKMRLIMNNHSGKP